MSADREVTRIVRSWLEEGPRVLPDRVLDAVLDQVPATPQRRAWRPAWRLPQMNTRLRIAAALAAVVVVALVAVNLVPKSSSVGGPPSTTPPTSTHAPAATSTPSPSPMALPSADASGNPASLDPGTYVAGDPFPMRITFTVPAGWEGVVPGPYLVALDQQHGSGALNFSIFQNVYANPCQHRSLLNPLPGPTVDDLATALASLPGLTATAPTDVTFAGYQGKKLTLTAPDARGISGCPDGAFRIWQLPLGATNDLTAGEMDQIWILEVGGQRLVIDAPQIPQLTSEETQEVHDVLYSAHLAPPAPRSSEAPTASASTGPTLVDGFTPGTLVVTVGSHEGAWPGITCQSQANGQLSILDGSFADGEFFTLIFQPDGTVSSLSGAFRGVGWQVTRNAHVTLNPDKKSGSFLGTDASGEKVSGNFACT